MFCTGCGIKSADSDLFCGGCGNAQRDTIGKKAHVASTRAVFQVGQVAPATDLPDGVAGWSWGAFLLPWVWAIGNSTWIGLLALIPYVNIPVMIWLGIKGREMAWRNSRWDSLEHFNRVQRRWSQWGIGITCFFLSVFIIGITVAVGAAASQAARDTSDATVSKQESVASARSTG